MSKNSLGLSILVLGIDKNKRQEKWDRDRKRQKDIAGGTKSGTEENVSEATCRRFHAELIKPNKLININNRHGKHVKPTFQLNGRIKLPSYCQGQYSN